MGEWAALGATVDRRAHARTLRRAHDRMASGGRTAPDAPAPPGIRPVIARSWQRSLAAGLEPTLRGAEPPLSAQDLAARRERHPLRLAAGVVERAFAGVDDPHHLIFVTDADGALLWLEGRPATISQANEAGIVVGRSYAERHRGTSAVGTCLAEGRPLQIFAGEHFDVGFHAVGCSAAPVRDPLGGDVVGVVGVAGAFTATHPHSLSVVSLAARSIEHELLADARPGEPGRPAVDDVTISVLGRSRGRVRIGMRHVELSRRHTEMLLLLVLCPGGLTAESMAAELYGPGGRPGTVRAEMHRLRDNLGDLIGERPYRLLRRVRCDVGQVDELLQTGRVHELLELSPGSTLDRTRVPRLVDLRDAIAAGVRGAVLASGEVTLLERWLRTPAGRDDAEASRVLMGRLDRDDPRRAAERSRLRRLLAGDTEG